MRLERNLQKKKKNQNIAIALLFIFSISLYYTYINLDSIVNSVFNSTEDQQYNLIIGNKTFLTNIIIEGDEIYIPLEKVQENIYPGIILEVEGRYAFLELAEENFLFKNKEIDTFVKSSPTSISILVKNLEDTIYFPVKSTQYLLGAQISYSSEIDRLLVTSKYDNFLRGVTLKDQSITSSPKLLSKTITHIPKNSHIQVYESLDNHYKIRTEEGYLGYIKKSDLALDESVPVLGESPNFFNTTSNWSPPKHIGLVWDYIKYFNHDRSDTDKLNAVDVISPTWFRMVDEDGTILNSGSYTYANEAKSKGYKIWGLVTNSFDPDLTSAFLANDESINNFIRQILLYSSFYGLDGINIDFENIYYKDQYAFTEFVRLLTDKLHKQNLIVSIDITIPSNSPNWSMVYDRKKLGEIVDYVAVMTYDEHWGSSPKSGSVASIGWVEGGIQRTLESIPAEKVLLGLPFYTRLWEEEMQSNGRVKVSSKAYGMSKIHEILEENKAEIIWDNTTGQYYSQYESEGKTYKVWLEDERSLALKTSLIEKYGLAGFAAWRKDFEELKVWETLDQVVKKGVEYNHMVFK